MAIGFVLAQQGRQLFPESAAYQASAGQICVEAHDVACAEEALKRALELDLSHAAARRSMDALKKQQSGKGSGQ